MDQITAGFMPLLDASILITAREKGFAEDENIELTLKRETSWANIRDRIAVGHFDVAHMLAPMPIASNLGLTPLSLPLIAPMALGLGGNAITVSADLWADMADRGAAPNGDPSLSGAALKAVVLDRQSRAKPRLRFAVVHPHSGHNYEMRFWMAACGIDPDADIEVFIIPPPLMPDALANGHIDGFCVGEPWNSVAIAGGSGKLATTKAAIWKSSPEKVLGTSARWAHDNEALLLRLIRALYRAAEWNAAPENLAPLVELMAAEDYLGDTSAHISGALSGKLETGLTTAVERSDLFLPVQRAATFPWQSHALWFYTQMVRWGQIEHCSESAAIAAGSYSPALYRKALGAIGAPLPGANAKVEGALDKETPAGALSAKTVALGPDGFFDDTTFDPDKIDDYILGQQKPSA